MVYVNQKQLDQVEYILEQSTHGYHLLFDMDEIRRVFLAKGGTFEFKKTAKDKKGAAPSEAEKHIENLILQPTILSKRTYLENLPDEVFEDVVRTYFNIVENNIFEGMEYKH